MIKLFAFLRAGFGVSVLLASAGLLLAGCSGEDTSPPKDPSYYTGPMKGKGETTQQGEDK